MSIENGERYLRATEEMAEYTRKVKELLETGKRYYNNPPETVDGDIEKVISSVYAYVGSVLTVGAWAYNIKGFSRTKSGAVANVEEILRNGIFRNCGYNYWRGADLIYCTARDVKKEEGYQLK